MNKGLATLLLSPVVSLLLSTDDSTLKVSLFHCLSLALNLGDLTSELSHLLTDPLLRVLLSSSESSTECLQRLAKNYPEVVLQSYERLSFNKYFTLAAGGKRAVAVLRVLEEWVK
jgi:hypothetical protein